MIDISNDVIKSNDMTVCGINESLTQMANEGGKGRDSNFKSDMNQQRH